MFTGKVVSERRAPPPSFLLRQIAQPFFVQFRQPLHDICMVGDQNEQHVGALIESGGRRLEEKSERKKSEDSGTLELVMFGRSLFTLSSPGGKLRGFAPVPEGGRPVVPACLPMATK